MAAAHSIYADEMASLVHGTALWEPECHPEVSIADVGYIRLGKFSRLFNASLPLGHPTNHFGVPEGYEPLNIDERAMIERRLPPGAMVSRSITKRGADMEISGSVLEAGAGFEFSCTKDRGAVLIINSDARRKDSEQRGAFKKYMLKHYKSWWSFANNEPHCRDISLSDLVFVTGRDNTADWAVAAFAERSISGGISFEAGYPTIAGAKFSIWGSWKGLRTVHSHCGPRIPRASIEHQGTFLEGTESPTSICAADMQAYDQCVFLRGFRVLDRTTQVRQKIGLKVSGSSSGLEPLQKPWISRTSSTGWIDASKGQSNSNWGKQHSHPIDPTPERGNTIDVDIVSNEPLTHTPVESVLAYILEQEPKASVAIAHDDNLAALIKNSDNLLDLLGFDALLKKVSPHIDVDADGVGTIYAEPTRRRRKVTIPSIDVVRPDSVAYNVDQERIKAEINVLQIRLSTLQDQISHISKTGRGAERRTLLRAELDSLRDQELAHKASRGATTAELKRIQEENRTKIKDLQGLAKRLPAKTIVEVESQIRTLDRRIGAGTMSLSEEKKVVGQINNLKCSRTVIETYQTIQAAVDANRSRADELRKRLDTPPNDPSSERLETVRAELIALQRERDEAFSNRGELYSERDELQKKLSALHEQRRKSVELFRENRETYWRKVHEDRAKEAERIRAEKNILGVQRRAEARERLLEKARAPAFAAEIQDCRSLLEYFLSKPTHATSPTIPNPAQRRPSELESRPPRENHPGAWAGWVPLKKKQEDAYFVGGKGKAKKGSQQGAPSSTVPSSKVRIPLGIMSTLVSLDIVPPTMTAEIPRTIENLQKKIEWFEVNQTRVTEENVARTEADLHRIGHVMNTPAVSSS